MLKLVINYKRLMAEATMDAIFARRPFCMLINKTMWNGYAWIWYKLHD